MRSPDKRPRAEAEWTYANRSFRITPSTHLGSPEWQQFACHVRAVVRSTRLTNARRCGVGLCLRKLGIKPELSRCRARGRIRSVLGQGWFASAFAHAKFLRSAPRQSGGRKHVFRKSPLSGRYRDVDGDVALC